MHDEGVLATIGDGLMPGDVVEGGYRIIRLIGAGGVSVVYEALHIASGEAVAIKVLRQRAAESTDTIERFRREVLAIARLNSPHVARVFTVETPRDRVPYIVLELLTGNDLADELDLCGSLPVGTAVDYVTQAAQAMAFVHAHGIIHRDLKPANLFLCSSSPSEQDGQRTVKVLDFGISKLRELASTPLTRTFAVFGTPEYMSPEQVQAARDVDVRSDVWSLGVVLFECLTGRPPFKGPATRVIAAVAREPIPRLEDLGVHVPHALEAVLLQMLERDLAHRLPSADAVVQALAPFNRSDSAPQKRTTT